MVREGLNPTSLAAKLAPGNAKAARNLQPRIHRFLYDDTEARLDLLKLITRHFGLPLEAVTDDKLAASIAKERGVKALPPREPKPSDREILQGAHHELPGLAAKLLEGIDDARDRAKAYSLFARVVDRVKAGDNVRIVSAPAAADATLVGSKPTTQLVQKK